MNNTDFEQRLTNIEKDIKELKVGFTDVVKILLRINESVETGFNAVNDRLASLEGKQGMQGVNSQLSEIKHELHKIQSVYNYSNEYQNLLSIKKGGEA